MRVINNTLYIEFAEMVACGVSENYLWKAKSIGTKCWAFMDDPTDKRKVLIEYDKLKDQYKKKIQIRFGNPYEYTAKRPIRELIQYDDKAEEFYLSYRFEENKTLPIEHVKKYTMAASVLNMLKKATEDKRTIKKMLRLSIDKFYNHVIDIIKAEGIELPASYRRLLATRKEYETNGYATLIDWRFGNKLAAKVKDELSESVLLEMIAHPNQYDDVFIATQYNKWAKDTGYKTIDDTTVGHWRRKREHLIIMGREGNSELNEKYIRDVKGHRPNAPLYLVESDDNHLDLYFIDPNDDNEGSKYTHRYKAIVVIDSFNDYVLGYAYAENLSSELVKAAYLNAMYHIREVTGGWHLPHETKTDNWSIASLRPFYKNIGKYIDTPVGSKHRGYIEQFFGTPHWKRCLKIGANNYNGNNLTAKHRGVNIEALARAKKDRPLTGDEATTQIENFFHRLRYMEENNGLSKHDEWLMAWNNLPADKKRPITDEQFLLKFGITHFPKNGIEMRITNRGVEPQINGIKYSYDLDTKSLVEYVGKKVSIVYDPFDMGRVLVTDFENVRVIAREPRLQSRALKDANIDSRKFLNAIFSEKAETVEKIAEKSERRKKVLESAAIDPESILKAGIMVKEIKQAAEERMLAQTTDGQGYDDDNIYDQM